MKHHFRFNNKEIMIPFFCFRCSRISSSAEGLRCPQCDRDESGSVIAPNFYSAIPEYGNVSPEYYVTVEDASTQVSEDDFIQEEPFRETSTQTFEEEFPPLSLTREASTQTSDDGTLQIDGGHGYENCTKADSPFQNKTSDDLYQYTNENQNLLTANSNTNEGELNNPSDGICYSSTSPESMDETYVTSQQAYISEQTSVSECKNNHYSDELPRRHGIVKPTALRNKADKLDLKCEVAYESKNPIPNNFSDSSDNVKDTEEKGMIEPTFSSLSPVNPSINKCFPENVVTAKTMAEQKSKTFNKFKKKDFDNAKDGKDKDSISPSFSSFPRGNQHVNKCFQENLVTANIVAQQKSESSSKWSRRWCGMCGEYFRKEWTFNAHYCNPSKPHACAVCGETFRVVVTMLEHERLHSREKPFKCTQCDFATVWKRNLRYHAKRHTNLSSPSSSSRSNPPVRKCFQKRLLTEKTNAQQKSQTSRKLSKRKCPKCRRLVKEATLKVHIQSNCNPNPYKCKECDKRFPYEFFLIRHKRVHTGVKPFKCNQCDYAAAQPHSLKKHMEKHRQK